MTYTATVSTMDISNDAYREIKARLTTGQREDLICYDGEVETGIHLSDVMITPYAVDEVRDKVLDAMTTKLDPEMVQRDESTHVANVPQGYDSLAEVLIMALDQAACGKGKERHAQGDTPFDRQPICELPRMVGPAGTAYQVMKKTQEAMRMDADRAVKELLGAINYAAATILILREREQARMGDNVTDDIKPDLGGPI